MRIKTEAFFSLANAARQSMALHRAGKKNFVRNTYESNTQNTGMANEGKTSHTYLIPGNMPYQNLGTSSHPPPPEEAHIHFVHSEFLFLRELHAKQAMIF
jgi:hypothetical protein